MIRPASSKKHVKIACTTTLMLSLLSCTSLVADTIGLIGGENDSSGAPFAALVSSSGTVALLSPLPSTGIIRTVAINA